MSLLEPRAGGEGHQEGQEGAVGAKQVSKNNKKKKVPGSERRRRQREKAEAGPRVPIELLLRIIEIGADLKPGGRAESAVLNRRAFLCKTSLISAACRNLSQRLLWSFVTIQSDRKAKLFLRAPKKRYTSPYLELFMDPKQPEPMDGNLARQVVEACRGVVDLVINGVFGLDPEVFRHPGLRDLRFLRIGVWTWFTYTSDVSLRVNKLPFKLFSLDFSSVWTEEYRPRAVASALLDATEHKANIKLLPSAEEGTAPNPRPLAGSASAGGILAKPSSLGAFDLRCPNYDEFVYLAKHLRYVEHLVISTANTAFLAAIPSQLHKLSIVSPSRSLHEARDTIEALFGKEHLCMSKLKILEMPDYTEVPGIHKKLGIQPDSIEGRRLLEKECKARGIKPMWTKPEFAPGLPAGLRFSSGD